MEPRKMTDDERNLAESVTKEVNQALRGNLKHLARRFDSFEDAFQSAMHGACYAATQFKPEVGVKFWTFAWYWARAFMQKSLRRKRLNVYLDCDLTHRDAGITVNHDYATVRARQHEFRTTFVNSFAVDKKTRGPVASAIRNETREIVHESLRSLHYREREVLQLAYGITDGHEYTYEEIGKIFGVARSRAGAILMNGVRRIKTRKKLALAAA